MPIDEAGWVFDIQHNSYVDGPGLRTTVFLMGCNLRCQWCHNPESWNRKPSLLFYRDKCLHCGSCHAVCPRGACSASGELDREVCAACGKCQWICPGDARLLCGQKRTAEEVFREVERDKAYYDTSGGGVTLSGGECLLQKEFCLALLRLCHTAGIHIAIDTAGNVLREVLEDIHPLTDMFLYDVKCADTDLHIQGTGVANGQILENLRYLLSVCPQKVAVRIPVIPGFNTCPGEMEHIAQLLLDMPNAPLWVEPLPYHRMGENKARAMDFAPSVFSIPSEETMQGIRALFASLYV